MQITFNQQSITCPKGCSIAALLEQQAILSKHIAVARNGVVIKRELWAETILEAEDNILVIGAIKGG